VKPKTSAKTPSLPIEPKTLGEALYWSYANLAMAHAYKRHKERDYQQVDFIVRNKTFHGLLRGTLQLGSFLKDEKSKLMDKHCSYCRSESHLSLDHLIPQFSGGPHSADNLVFACRSCNSSKGKQDLLAWMRAREQFPPLKPLRRYLKLAIIFSTENNFMSVPMEEIDNLKPTLPFSPSLLPFEFPAPHVFRKPL